LEVIDEWGASTIAPQIKINIKADEVSTDIEAIEQWGNEAIRQSRKVIFNSRLYILHNGIYYDVLGNKITDIQDHTLNVSSAKIRYISQEIYRIFLSL
jgi:hypothetical protein